MADGGVYRRRDVLRTTGALGAAATLGTLGAGPAGASAHGSHVKVNQVGYLPDRPKVGVVNADQVSGTTFEVVDATDGSTATSGSLSAARTDSIAGHRVRYADFSDLTTPGEYELRVGGRSSFPFRVGTDVYDDVLTATGRLYTLKRSNQRIDDPVTGISFGPGHTQDAQATVMAGDGVYSQGETVDVAGGWYDAGDYGKYTAPSSIALAAKLTAYERNPDAFTTGQYSFPSGVSTDVRGTMPDELVENRWKLTWLEKMQRRDGATWFKVAGTEWPENDVRPGNDGMQRYVFGLSSAATAMACACFAMAGRIYREHDRAFADRMLANAEDAWAWLQDNPDLVWRTDPQQDSGSGGYHRGASFEDPNRFVESDLAPDNVDGALMERFDRFWAAAELLKTTGDATYDDHLQSEHADLFSQYPIDFDWYTGFPIGLYHYYTADAADDARRAEVESAMVQWADERLAHVRDDGYNNALEDRDYHWASVQKGATYGVMFLLANEMQPKEAYVNAALDQLHHVLGRSATGYSYVTEMGEHTPTDPHDRLVNSTGVLLPGMVVGGPNDANMWPGGGMTAGQVPYANPGRAQLYADVFEHYECNEWAINYTAPVHWLLAEATTLEDLPEPSACPGSDAAPAWSDGTTPFDVDGDGVYEDFNGNCEFDSDDVVTYFQEIDRTGIQENPTYYDANGNGNADFDDVVTLFQSL